MDIKNYKILAVLTSPGMGVNHFSNMISTSPSVANRKIGAENYKEFLINLYSTSYQQFHADEFLLFGVEDWTKAYHLVKNNQQTTVLPGHMEDAYWVLKHVCPLGPIGAITFEIFDFDLEEFYRKKRNQSYTNYNPAVYKFLYTKDVVSRILDIPNDDILAVDAARLHRPNVDQLLEEIDDVLNLDLDMDLCKKLHTLWYTTTNSK